MVISILYSPEMCPHLGERGVVDGEAGIFLSTGSSLIPRDAHVYRKPSRKPLNSVAKCSDPSTADPDIVLGPN